jgi:putative MATE family efflux protein
MDQRTRRLLEAPIVPLLIRLALPNVIIMIVQSAVSLAEAYFIGMLGTDALAGITLVVPILMLTQMMSAGAMGGGISSAVARALGSGRGEDASALVWHAVAIALGFGIVTTVIMVGGGTWIYRDAMGGRDGTLSAALTYSNVVFGGAILIWLFNSLANVVRGTGNMIVPATITLVGALIIIPLSPVLIFGLGPFPAFGVMGGAVASIGYYALGCVALVFFIWGKRGVLRPTAWPHKLHWPLTRDILRVGLIACLITVTTNLTVAVATALVSAQGPSAVAGYGVGSRLEYLLIPLAFGMGGPLVAMVGTAMGAGRYDRALHVAWIGAAFNGALSEIIGLAAAFYPHAWLSLFGNDPLMLETGTHYLHIVGPAYGFFGAGMVMYFASQGAGKLKWPLIGGLMRLAIGTLGGWIGYRLAGATGVFAALALALVTLGIVNAGAVYFRVWFDRTDGKSTPDRA